MVGQTPGSTNTQKAGAEVLKAVSNGEENKISDGKPISEWQNGREDPTQYWRSGETGTRVCCCWARPAPMELGKPHGSCM